MAGLFILDDIKYSKLLIENYKMLLNSYIGSNLELNLDKTFMTGNILFNIFKNININSNFNTNFYSLKLNNSNSIIEPNILEILKLTNNKMGYYQEKIYILEELIIELNNIIKNNYSEKYNLFLLNKFIKQDIFDYIQLVDLDNFNIVAHQQYNLIKNKKLPINYAIELLNNKHINNIIKNILIKIVDILAGFQYEFHPKLFDPENQIINNYNIKCLLTKNINNIRNIYDLIYFILNSQFELDNDSNMYILLRIITIFKLDYTDANFVLNLNQCSELLLDQIIETIYEKKIYDNIKFLYLLLCLNKIDLFIKYSDNKKNNLIDFKYIIKYIIKYESYVSFYYLLENYEELNITKIMSSNLLKIYMEFLNNNNNKNQYIINYIKLNLEHIQEPELKYLLNNLNELESTEDNSNIIKLLIVNYNPNNLNIFNNSNLDIIIKNILIDPSNNILFDVLNNYHEDVFYILINLIDFEEKTLINRFTDLDGNTINHIICKNSMCIGFKIDNTIRNNLGYLPLDMCQISPKYYNM